MGWTLLFVLTRARPSLPLQQREAVPYSHTAFITLKPAEIILSKCCTEAAAAAGGNKVRRKAESDELKQLFWFTVSGMNHMS